MPTEIFEIQAGEDDGTAKAGVWDYVGLKLIVGREDGDVLSSAYRFRNVTIPKEAYIHEARLITEGMMTGRNVGKQKTTLVGIKEPNTTPFTSNPLDRPETLASVSWDNYDGSRKVGYTTADGKADGSTVIITTRTENDEHWKGGLLGIRRLPEHPEEWRTVLHWVKETGTFIMEEPFSHQVLAGSEYVLWADYIRSSNLASIIREIIDQPEWRSGNSIGLKHLGDRSDWRTYCEYGSYEGFGVPPRLEITWEILAYSLTINTAPISGVEFTLDSLVEVTPFSADVSPGTYTITMPEIVTVNGKDYRFAGWADGPTERVRTIDIAADTTLTANYEVAPVTHTANVESTPVTGVPVTVDDVFVGNTPVSVSVIEGDHTFVVPEEVEA